MTLCSIAAWCSTSRPAIRMASMMAVAPSIPSSIWSIIRWNISGAHLRPKGSRCHLYLPIGVLNEESSGEASSSLICKNPLLASSLEKTFAFAFPSFSPSSQESVSPSDYHGKFSTLKSDPCSQPAGFFFRWLFIEWSWKHELDVVSKTAKLLVQFSAIPIIMWMYKWYEGHIWIVVNFQVLMAAINWRFCRFAKLLQTPCHVETPYWIEPGPGMHSGCGNTADRKYMTLCSYVSTENL